MQGGTVSAANAVWLGNAVGSVGTVSLSAGLLAGSNILVVGNQGLASFNQSGGTATFAGDINEANSATATGTITLTGGFLTASGALVVGNSGLASFMQSGGTTSFGGAITLGANPRSLGTLNLANSLLATTAGLTVGASGAGVFTEASGTTSAGGSILLGANAGGSGNFGLVSGQVFATGSLVVGNAGAGLFTQSSGTTSAGGAILLGANAGSSGALSLSSGTVAATGSLVVGSSGEGSYVQTGGTTSLGGQLVVGANNGATGVVSLGNGLMFTANTITIGNNTGASGLVTVGSGGALVGSKQIVVGNNGDGQLTIAAGGTVQTTMLPQTSLFAVQIGNSFGSAGPANGAVLVTGTGALLTSNGNPASIGPSGANGNVPGAGSLTVAQGGSVVFGTPDSNLFSALTIGKYGEGTVTVTDPGSTLTVNGFFSMGRGGAGTLLVQNHGSVAINQAPANGSGFGIGVGQSSSATTVGGNAQVYVESGGKIFMDGSFGNSIQVGGNGVNGALTVNGGTVESSYRMRIGLSVTLSGTLYAGSGVVAVGAGGTILADGTGITTAAVPGIVVGDGVGAIGEMDVRGAAALASANGHTIRVGNVGVGHMNIGQAGTVLAGSAFAGDAAVEIGKTAGAEGFVDLTDTGSALTATGSLAIGDAGFGELSIAAGAVVSATAATLGVQAGGVGQAMLGGTGGKLVLSGALVVGGAGAGVLSIATGGDVIATSVTIGSAGAVNMLGGTLDPPSIFNNGVITGFGFLDGPLVNAGSLIASGGTLEIAGDVSGGGSLALGSGGLVLDGAVAAGTTISFTDGPGALTVSAPARFAAAISGFASGDTLSFLGVTAASYDTPSHTLSVITASGSIALPLVATTGAIHLSSTANGLLVAACFAEGTHLLAPEGRMPVEAIRPGQMLRTAEGGVAPVIWVGRRRLDVRRHRRRQDVMPVRVRAGAFAAGVPARDVLLSPDHAVFVGGVLVPIRYLANGRTIVQERVESITYWHVELPRHGVVLAEGLPCESYLDTGNRSAFEGGGPALDLHPDFARAVWAAEGCARLVTEGAEVIAARAELLARAGALGHARTDDPALTVTCDGRELPLCFSDDLVIASLPRGAERVRLRSRRFIPAETTADETDTRRLGVAIAALWADGRKIPLDDPRLASGWHAAEPDWRWTDGDAGLLLPGVRDLALRLTARGTYWAATRPLHRHATR